jgi:hypothetical protein
MRSLLLSSEKRAGRYGWICLLLALSFLYNPYLMALGSGLSLNVRHSASHRATVGASELQHLAPMSSWEAQPAADVIAIGLLYVVPDRNSGTFVIDTREALPPQELFFANLWFRPPPAS